MSNPMCVHSDENVFSDIPYHIEEPVRTEAYRQDLEILFNTRLDEVSQIMARCDIMESV